MAKIADLTVHFFPPIQISFGVYILHSSLALASVLKHVYWDGQRNKLFLILDEQQSQ